MCSLGIWQWQIDVAVDEQRVNVVIALTESPEHWRQLGDGYRVNAGSSSGKANECCRFRWEPYSDTGMVARCFV